MHEHPSPSIAVTHPSPSHTRHCAAPATAGPGDTSTVTLVSDTPPPARCDTVPGVAGAACAVTHPLHGLTHFLAGSTAAPQTGGRTDRRTLPTHGLGLCGWVSARGGVPLQESFTQGRGVPVWVQLAGCPWCPPTVPVSVCPAVPAQVFLWSLPRGLRVSPHGPCPRVGDPVWVSPGYPCTVPVSSQAGLVIPRVSLSPGCPCPHSIPVPLWRLQGCVPLWGHPSCPPPPRVPCRQGGAEPSPPRRGLQGAQPGSA